MAIKMMNPYLNFNGDAAKAIALYERVFGTKAEMVQTMADIPGNQPSPENAHRIIHARVPIAGSVVMISDGQPGVPVPTTSNVHVCLDFDDAKDAAAKFDALSAGGKITMPLQQTFWGATFGMLIDAHGISWMFNGPKD